MSFTGSTVVYGGSFNPPHMAHQMACLYFLSALGAERVLVVPSFRHPFGKELSDFSHRVTMCRALAEPFGARVSVETLESEPGASGRTFDTLTTLKQREPERRFALAVGADILAEAHKWYRWDDILRLVPLIVVGRVGYEGNTKVDVVLPNIASSDLRARARRGERLEGLVPLSISTYIEEHGLYRGVVPR